MKYGKRVDNFNNLRYLICDVCGKEEHPWYSVLNGEVVKCGDCSFRLGEITEVEYCDLYDFYGSGKYAAALHPITKEIEVTKGTIVKKRIYCLGSYKYVNIRKGRCKFTWEKSESELRQDCRYKSWKNKVFNRDNNKCQHCGTSHKIVAHHKVPVSENKLIVFDVDNGITLCASCHPKEHARMRKEK